MSLRVLEKKTLRRKEAPTLPVTRSSSGRTNSIRNKCGNGVFFSQPKTSSEYIREKKLKHISQGNRCKDNNINQNNSQCSSCNTFKDLTTKTGQEYINNKLSKCAELETKPKIPNTC